MIEIMLVLFYCVYALCNSVQTIEDLIDYRELLRNCVMASHKYMQLYAVSERRFAIIERLLDFYKQNSGTIFVIREQKNDKHSGTVCSVCLCAINKKYAQL